MKHPARSLTFPSFFIDSLISSLTKKFMNQNKEESKSELEDKHEDDIITVNLGNVNMR